MSTQLYQRSLKDAKHLEYSLDRQTHKKSAMKNFETVMGNNLVSFKSLQRGAPGLEYPARVTTNATVQEVDPHRLKLYSDKYQDYHSQAYRQAKGKSLRDLRAPPDVVGNKFMSRGLRNALNQDGHQMLKMKTIQSRPQGQFEGRSASHVNLIGTLKAEKTTDDIMPDLVLPQMQQNKRALPTSKQSISKPMVQHDQLNSKAENALQPSNQRQKKLSLKHSMRSLERRTKNVTALSQHKSDFQTAQTPYTHNHTITVTEQDKNSSSLFQYGSSELLNQDNKESHTPKKYQVVSRNSVFVSRTTPIYKKEYGTNNKASIQLSKRSSSSIELDDLKQLLQNHKSVALNVQENRNQKAVIGQSSSLSQHKTLPMKMGQKSAKVFNVKAYRKLAKNQKVKVQDVDQQYSRVVESYRPVNEHEPTEISYVNFDLPSTKTVKGRSKKRENLSTIQFEDEIDQINSEKIELGSSNTGTGTQNQEKAKQKQAKADSSFNTDLQMKISEAPSAQKPKAAEKVQQAKQVDPNDNFYATFSKIKNEKPDMFQPQQEVKVVGLDTLNYLAAFVGAKDEDSQNPTPHLQASQNRVQQQNNKQFFGQKRIESNSFNTNIPSTESLQILLVNRQKNAKAQYEEKKEESKTTAAATPDKPELHYKAKQQMQKGTTMRKPNYSPISTILNIGNDKLIEQKSDNIRRNSKTSNSPAPNTPLKYKFKSPSEAIKKWTKADGKSKVIENVSGDEGSAAKSKVDVDRSMFGTSSDESEVNELFFQSFDKERISEDVSVNDWMIIKTFGHMPTPEKTENLLPMLEGTQISRNKSDLNLQTQGSTLPHAEYSGLTASSKQLAIASQHIDTQLLKNKKAVQEVLNGKYLLTQAEVDQIEQQKYNINKIIRAYSRKTFKHIVASKNMDKLAQLTQKQNQNNKTLISNIESNQDFKDMVEFQGGSVNVTKDMNKEFIQILLDSEMKKSQINFRLLGQTSKEMKQVMQKAQKVVCNQENFHKQVYIANVTPDGQQHPLLNKIELCRSSQVNIKVAVKGHHSPLRLKIDYCNMCSGQVMTKPQLLQLKGFFDVYVSKKHRNPQPAIDPKEPSTATFETSYINQVPPRVIEIHSNEQNVPMVPFLQNWAYITIDCGEHALLDDIQLIIKATTMTLNPNQAQMNQSSNSFYSDEDDLEEKARQALLAKERRAKNQERSLFEFKKEKRNEINNLIECFSYDAGEWEEFQERLKMSKKRMKNKSKRSQQDIFLTTLGDEGGSLSPTDQLSPDSKLKQLLLAGDFVKHNQLSIRLQQHNKQGKINKINQMADKQRQLKDQLDKKNEGNNIEYMKRKVFLSHYNAILKYQKNKKDQEEYEIEVMRRKVSSWLKLMMINKILVCMFGHYLAKKKIQDHKKWMQLCVSRVSARLKWILRKKGKSYEKRRLNDIKQAMSLHNRCAVGSARKSGKAVLLDFLRNTSKTFEVQCIVDKGRFHAEWVEQLQVIYRRNSEKKLKCRAHMKKSWDKAQNYLMQRVAKLALNQKKADNMAKLQIYRSVGAKIKDEFCSKYLYYKKLMFQILDTYKLREKYLHEHLFRSIRRKLKRQMNLNEGREEMLDYDEQDDIVERQFDRNFRRSGERMEKLLLRAEALNKTRGLAQAFAMKALTTNEENQPSERMHSPKALQSERKSEKATERSKASTKSGDKPKKHGSKKIKQTIEVVEEKTYEERITELGINLEDEVPPATTDFVLCYADHYEMRKLVDLGVFHLQQRRKQAEINALALAARRKEELQQQQEQEEKDKAEQDRQENPGDTNEENGNIAEPPLKAKKEDKQDKNAANTSKKQ